MRDLASWVIEDGLVSEEQLATARHLGESGVPLPIALIQLQLLEEKKLVELVAKRTGLPQAPRRLHRTEVPAKALSLIPQDYCWQYGLFPFGFDAPSRRLQVAIMDPDDEEAIAAVRQLARQEPCLFVAGPRQIEKAIRRHYLDSLVEETNAPGQLRYFGYENITSPGAVRTRHATAPQEPQESSGPLGQGNRTQTDSGELAWEPPPDKVGASPPSALPASAAVAAQAPPEEVAAGAVPLAPLTAPRSARPPATTTPGMAPVVNPAPGTPPADDDLPVLKEPAQVLGRLQRGDSLADLAQRVDALEQMVSRLVALLAHDTRDTAGQLARLADEVQSRWRRRTAG
jgi:hypothetical protein